MRTITNAVITGLVMMVGAPAATAATTAGKCTAEAMQRQTCTVDVLFNSNKVMLKFCKSGAEDAAKFGEKLENSVNSCLEKGNRKLAKLNCTVEGDPDMIEGGSYDPIPLPVADPGEGVAILSGFAVLCDGADAP